MFKKILIVGCGLIGSSILRDSFNKKISKKIFVYEKWKKNISKIKKINSKVIILNKLDLRFVEKPKQPQTTYAAAIGAVIELVKPADSNPIAITYLEKAP